MRFILALLLTAALASCHGAPCGEKWWQERCPVVDHFPEPQP